MTSSNFEPSHLYKNGLQRGDFQPFIEHIISNFEVIYIDSDKDYRRLTLNQSKTYFTPINNETVEEFKLLFQRLVVHELLDLISFFRLGREVSQRSVLK